MEVGMPLTTHTSRPLDHVVSWLNTRDFTAYGLVLPFGCLLG